MSEYAITTEYLATGEVVEIFETAETYSIYIDGSFVDSTIKGATEKQHTARWLTAFNIVRGMAMLARIQKRRADDAAVLAEINERDHAEQEYISNFDNSDV